MAYLHTRQAQSKDYSNVPARMTPMGITRHPSTRVVFQVERSFDSL